MKFTDVNPFSKNEQSKINKSLLSTVKRGDFILGKNVEKFEKKFAKLANVKYSIGCATGTDALILSIKALNLKKKHEVIIPGMSYISTGLSLALNKTKICFADIDRDTGLMSLESVKNKINKNTRAIIPVNLYGQKVDIKKLRSIVGQRIFIIEDSAQSHFAFSCYSCGRADDETCCKKEHNHTYADLSCYSFYPSKNLGAYGDGGLITTDNINFYRKLKILRNLGTIKKNVHEYEGLNSRLDTIQASILFEKVNHTKKHNDYRRMISKYYDTELRFISEVKITETRPGSSRHLYVIRVKNRDKLLKYLQKNGVSSQLHYPYSLNRAGALKGSIKNVRLPISEQWAKECLSLPLYPYMKIKDAKKVVKTIKKYFKY